ncbi:MAG: DUF2336 domain-containing protein [Pseudomonadota bacterium]
MQSAVESLEVLESLAQDNSPQNQIEIMHRITDLFLMTENQCKEEDTELFGLALDHVAYKLPAEHRKELSIRLAETQKAPRRLLLKLANDKIIVAQPVLEQSPCLTDNDLASIVEAKGSQHQLAICHRETLPIPVTDALIKHGEQDVLCAVAKNEAAQLSSEGLHYLSEQAKTIQVLHQTLKQRKVDSIYDIAQVTEDIKQTVKQTVKQELMQRVSDVVDENINRIVETKLAAIKTETIQTQLTSVSEKDMSSAFQFSKKAMRSGGDPDPKRQLNEFALTGHARAQRIPETVKTLSGLTHISPKMAAHCLFRADLSALGVLCKANHFSRETFSALLQLRVVHKKLPKSVMADALQRYDVLRYEKALKVMDLLEQKMKDSEDYQDEDDFASDE